MSLPPFEITDNLHSECYREFEVAELCKVKFFAIAVTVHEDGSQGWSLDATVITSVCRCATQSQLESK